VQELVAAVMRDFPQSLLDSEMEIDLREFTVGEEDETEGSDFTQVIAPVAQRLWTLVTDASTHTNARIQRARRKRQMTKRRRTRASEARRAR
jgi:hypothetical protein